MARIEYYKNILKLNSSSEILNFFLETLIETNVQLDFFVDWKKARKNIERFKFEIGILNSIVGSNCLTKDLKKAIKKYPEVVKVIPLLIATRKMYFEVLEDNKNYPLQSSFNFTPKKSYSDEELDEIIRFCEKTGVIDLFNTITLLQDYLFGVEVGLDTHARKNRSGKAMELLVCPILRKIEKENRLIKVIEQKKFGFLEKSCGMSIPKKLKDRRFDIACLKEAKKINIEINFFSGTGSKPQEIVDSYINRQNELKKAGWEFVWITDGPGWKNQVNQISKGFKEIDFVLNLWFVKKGLLEHILKGI